MKNLLTKLGLLLLSAALVAGCAPKSYLVLLKDADGKVGEVVVKGAGGETAISKENYAASVDGSSKQAFLVSQEKIQEDFGRAIEAQPLLPVTFLLYFKVGGAELTPESQALIPKITETILGRQGVDISITGHTDTVGAEKLNERLALERAVQVSQLFDAAKLNIKEITVDSHGEKNLLIKTPDETDEPQNRRVAITVR